MCLLKLSYKTMFDPVQHNEIVIHECLAVCVDEMHYGNPLRVRGLNDDIKRLSEMNLRILRGGGRKLWVM